MNKSSSFGDIRSNLKTDLLIQRLIQGLNCLTKDHWLYYSITCFFCESFTAICPVGSEELTDEKKARRKKNNNKNKNNRSEKTNIKKTIKIPLNGESLIIGRKKTNMAKKIN